MYRRYVIENDTEQWVPFFTWFWREVDEHGQPAHPTPENPLDRRGAFPARWIAKFSAWRHTRGEEVEA